MHPYKILEPDLVLQATGALHGSAFNPNTTAFSPRTNALKRDDFELECHVVCGVVADYLVHHPTGCRIPLCPALPLLATVPSHLTPPSWVIDRHSVRKDQYDDLFQVVYVANLLRTDPIATSREAARVSQLVYEWP